MFWKKNNNDNQSPPPSIDVSEVGNVCNMNEGCNKSDQHNDIDQDQFSTPRSQEAEEGANEQQHYHHWKDAHDKVCRDRCSLIVTPQEVLESVGDGWNVPLLQDVLVWDSSNDSNKNKESVAKQVAAKFRHNDASSITETFLIEEKEAKNTTWSRGIVDSAFSVVTRGLWGEDCEDEYAEHGKWKQIGDEAMDEDCYDFATSQQFVNWTEPVININMTLSCLEIIKHAILNMSNEGNSQDKIILRYANNSGRAPEVAVFADINKAESYFSLIDSPLTVISSSWKDWCRRCCEKRSIENHSDGNLILNSISSKEADFLLQCMVSHGYVALFTYNMNNNEKETKQKQQQKHQQHEFVFLTSSLEESKMEMENRISTYKEQIEIVIAMWELDHALDSIHRLRDQYQEKADVCARRALDAQRRYKNTKVAMVELKRRKLLLQQLDTYNAQSLNVELARNSITDAICQRQVVSALGKTAKTLTSIRENNPNQYDDFLGDFQSELENINTINDSIKYDTQILVDEDDLLKELNSLTIEETVHHNDSNSSQPSAGGMKVLPPNVVNEDNLLLKELEELAKMDSNNSIAAEIGSGDSQQEEDNTRKKKILNDKENVPVSKKDSSKVEPLVVVAS